MEVIDMNKKIFELESSAKEFANKWNCKVQMFARIHAYNNNMDC